MRKYVIGGLAGAALMFSLQTFAEPAKEYLLTKIGYPVLVNGKEYVGNDLPFLNYDGNTYAPLKAVGDLVRTPVKWNDKLSRVEIGSTPVDEAFTLINNVPALKSGNKKYGLYGEGVAVQNGKYYVSLTMVSSLLSIGFKLDSTIQPSPSSYLDGIIQPQKPYPFMNFDNKYLDARTSYMDITITSPDKTKSYFISLKPSDVRGIIQKDDIAFVPVDDFFGIFGFKLTVENDDVNKIIYFVIQ